MSLSVFPKSHCCFQHQFTLHHAQQRKRRKIEFKILKAFFHRILSLFAVFRKQFYLNSHESSSDSDEKNVLAGLSVVNQ